MKTRLIKLQDKFILVSDEPKTNGDECIHLITFNKSIHHDIDNNLTKWWKIISENPDFSLLSEADCKTIGWVDVEKLAAEAVICNGGLITTEDETDVAFSYYHQGFKTAQSLNRKMFSLEDIRPLQDLLNKGYDPYDSAHHLQVQRMLKVIDTFIQSLQQNVWNVEVEMEDYLTEELALKGSFKNLRPKITNNSIKIIKLLNK